ncbi:hypothetical protein IWQ60_003714 [Tieghemiomyces parasiticus]|uniref:Nucleoside diphosphate kinase n=1 Tax=Tieghemiomyces parasiticus TaxID=78921 RepID=A0A9W8A9T3_9FUNG|nr:hypothetical protein IWQ60_003714 [Tieghemiomyces parasiticus]
MSVETVRHFPARFIVNSSVSCLIPDNRTLALIKPDGLLPRRFVDIKSLLAMEQFEIMRQKRIWLTPEQAAVVLADQAGQPDYDDQMAYLTCAPCLALELQKDDAVRSWLQLIGPADPAEAKAQAPDSLRAHFGTDSVRNAVHGPPDVTAATQQIQLIFSPDVVELEALSANDYSPRAMDSDPAERTLVFIKPDAMAAGHKAAIVAQIEARGFRITHSLEKHMSREEAAAFYILYKGQIYYDLYVDFMSSGPVSIMVLEGENVIAGWREMMGPTNPLKAKRSAPMSIRARFGTITTRNAVHGSNSEGSVARGIEFFFEKPFVPTPTSAEVSNGQEAAEPEISETALAADAQDFGHPVEPKAGDETNADPTADSEEFIYPVETPAEPLTPVEAADEATVDPEAEADEFVYPTKASAIDSATEFTSDPAPELPVEVEAVPESSPSTEERSVSEVAAADSDDHVAPAVSASIAEDEPEIPSSPTVVAEPAETNHREPVSELTEDVPQGTAADTTHSVSDESTTESAEPVSDGLITELDKPAVAPQTDGIPQESSSAASKTDEIEIASGEATGSAMADEPEPIAPEPTEPVAATTTVTVSATDSETSEPSGADIQAESANPVAPATAADVAQDIAPDTPQVASPVVVENGSSDANSEPAAQSEILDDSDAHPEASDTEVPTFEPEVEATDVAPTQEEDKGGMVKEMPLVDIGNLEEAIDGDTLSTHSHGPTSAQETMDEVASPALKDLAPLTLVQPTEEIIVAQAASEAEPRVESASVEAPTAEEQSDQEATANTDSTLTDPVAEPVVDAILSPTKAKQEITESTPTSSTKSTPVSTPTKTAPGPKLVATKTTAGVKTATAKPAAVRTTPTTKPSGVRPATRPIPSTGTSRSPAGAVRSTPAAAERKPVSGATTSRAPVTASTRPAAARATAVRLAPTTGAARTTPTTSSPSASRSTTRPPVSSAARSPAAARREAMTTSKSPTASRTAGAATTKPRPSTTSGASAATSRRSTLEPGVIRKSVSTTSSTSSTSDPAAARATRRTSVRPTSSVVVTRPTATPAAAPVTRKPALPTAAVRKPAVPTATVKTEPKRPMTTRPTPGAKPIEPSASRVRTTNGTTTATKPAIPRAAGTLPRTRPTTTTTGTATTGRSSATVPTARKPGLPAAAKQRPALATGAVKATKKAPIALTEVDKATGEQVTEKPVDAEVPLTNGDVAPAETAEPSTAIAQEAANTLQPPVVDISRAEPTDAEPTATRD